MNSSNVELPLDPGPECDLCPRLVDFRHANRQAYPDFHNAPVAAFGPLDAELLVVGLAPGLKGANCTGRPFTGDYAGDVLYPGLSTNAFATGSYGGRPDDGLTLVNCRITNAVRCVPPQNKPTGPEANACRPFLIQEMANMPNLRILLALGKIAHDQVLKTLGLKLSFAKFTHGALHELPDGRLLANSYHCSRYNVNTGRLTQKMFDEVLASIRQKLA